MSVNPDQKKTMKKKINLVKELKSMKCKAINLQSFVDQSAAHLRNAIFDIKWTMPSPILPSDLPVNQFPIPGCLCRFLKGLLTSNPDETDPPSRVMSLESFSQDLM